MSTIDRVEISEFSFEVENIGLEQATAGIGNMAYVRGSKFTASRYAVLISTDDDGLQGEYVTHWVGTPSSLGQTLMLSFISAKSVSKARSTMVSTSRLCRWTCGTKCKAWSRRTR